MDNHYLVSLCISCSLPLLISSWGQDVVWVGKESSNQVNEKISPESLGAYHEIPLHNVTKNILSNFKGIIKLITEGTIVIKAIL